MTKQKWKWVKFDPNTTAGLSMGLYLKINQWQSTLLGKQKRIVPLSRTAEGCCVCHMTWLANPPYIFRNLPTNACLWQIKPLATFTMTDSEEYHSSLCLVLPLCFCQTKTREQLPVRYLLRLLEYQKLQSQTLSPFRLWAIFPPAQLFSRASFSKLFYQSLFPQDVSWKVSDKMTAIAHSGWSPTWCAVWPCRPSQPSGPICSESLRVKCQLALMLTQRTIGTQCRDWLRAAGEFTAKDGAF